VLKTDAQRKAVEDSGLRVITRSSWPNFCAVFGMLFDAARAPLSMPQTRWYYFEELLFGMLTGVIGGWEPLSPSTCRTLGVLLLVVAVAHLAFLLRVRPYGAWLDLGFAFAHGLGVAAAAVCAVARVGTDVMDYLMMFQMGLFVVQPVAVLIHDAARKLQQRRKTRHALETKKLARIAALTAPLLVVPVPQQNGDGDDDAHQLHDLGDDQEMVVVTAQPRAAGPGQVRTSNPLQNQPPGAWRQQRRASDPSHPQKNDQ
jgi:hypothetical protein